MRRIFVNAAIKLPTYLRPCTHAVIRRYTQWINDWESIITDQSDSVAIGTHETTREAYALIDRHWQSARQAVIADLPANVVVPYDLISNRRIVGQLIARIEAGIPPNECGKWPKTTPARIADIWNAAWAYKIAAINAYSDPAADEHLETLFRLTLKAVEASYVQKRFNALQSNVT